MHEGDGGTQLLFWYECKAQRAENRDLENDCCQIWDLKELFLSNLRLFELKFAPVDSRVKNWTFLLQFWGSEMQIFQKIVISGECMVLNWKILEWGLKEQSGGREKGVLRAALTRIPFSGEYPPPRHLSLKFFLCCFYLPSRYDYSISHSISYSCWWFTTCIISWL